MTRTGAGATTPVRSPRSTTSAATATPKRSRRRPCRTTSARPAPVAPPVVAAPAVTAPMAGSFGNGQAPTPEQIQAAQRDARDRGFLWRISKDGRSSYLYGTLHVGKLDWAFPGPRLAEALRDTDALAVEIGRKIRGFESALYPDWTALLEGWRDRYDGEAVLAIDEFPYLAKVSPELPSVFQKLLDQSGRKPVRLLLWPWCCAVRSPAWKKCFRCGASALWA